MKRVLVTGATGFIGRHCLPLLIDQGYEVHAFARETPACVPAVVWHRGDLLAPGAPSSLIEAVRPTHLLHLAWCASPNDYLTNPSNLRWTVATAELAEAFVAAGGDRFVGAGTCAEYAPSATPCHERDTPAQPASIYGQAKVAAFERLSELAADAKLSFAWGRIFFPYGPYQAPERLIPAVITSLLRGDPMACTAGDLIRDFIHVRDAAEALVAMLSGGIGGACNIGSGARVSVREMVTSLARIADGRSPVRFGVRSLSRGETAPIVADTRRIREELGWRPRIGLEDGLLATVEWWRRRLAA
jgi:nucleoside-diphosphate-sugar epimerase